MDVRCWYLLSCVQGAAATPSAVCKSNVSKFFKPEFNHFPNEDRCRIQQQAKENPRAVESASAADGHQRAMEMFLVQFYVNDLKVIQNQQIQLKLSLMALAFSLASVCHLRGVFWAVHVQGCAARNCCVSTLVVTAAGTSPASFGVVIHLFVLASFIKCVPVKEPLAVCLSLLD